MLGTEENPGIMVLTLEELFNQISINSNEREYKVKLSYLEIYNECIRDLMTAESEYLDLREDPNKGVSVNNLLELTVTSCKDIMHLLRKGNKNRTTEATYANEASSRSHAILQITVEHKDKNSGIETEIRSGKLSLIDLAGSERASATQNRGIRLIEGANINRSLLTLGNCINGLCEAIEKGTKPHIPYRDSKLTRLLKDSLGGNARTVMIANVSPGAASFEDTYNTLKYANRAKNIKTNPNRNVTNVQHHISNYTNIINNLKNEVMELKTQLSKKEHHQIKNENLQTLNNEAQINFEKCVIELVTICEKEYTAKKIILVKEQELNQLQLTQSQIKICQSNEIDLENNDLKIANEEKIDNLKTQIELNKDKLIKYQKRREKMASHWYKKGLKDFYVDYLQNIQRNHKSKLIILVTKVKERVNLMKISNKDILIKELENQLKLRDNIIKNNNINPEEFEPSILPLEKIHSECAALPQIGTKIDESFSGHITSNSISNLNLPPINISNKEKLKNNVERFYSNSNIPTETSITNNIPKPERQDKSENIPTQSQAQTIANVGLGNLEKNQGSHGNILNLNCIQKCKDNIKNLLENKSPNSNLRRNFSPNSRKNSNVPPNIISKKSKNSISKVTSEKQIREHRDFSSNIKILAKKKEKDNLSDISINSGANDSFEKDRDNSVDSKRKQKLIHNVQNVRLYHFKEKKTNQNQSNLSIGENQNHTSNQIQANNQNQNNLINIKINDKIENNKIEKDNFFNNKQDVPLIKKKDLNVFLYDRQKFRNNLKKPFK